MLVNLHEILKKAENERCAVGSFNTPNLETILGVLNAAEALQCSVILMHAEVHEELIPIDIIGPIMLRLAERANVPVCVHLDHGENIEFIRKAVNMGFTSVMYDGSLLPYEENVENTKKVVEFSRKLNVSVEAELGVINREAGFDSKVLEVEKNIYTDPVAAKKFVEATNIDVLACAFGTAHGIYKEKPCLDFDRLRKISDLVNIPLVMHGGSGVSVEDYRMAIAAGIRKINYYTYMSKYAGEMVKKRLDQLTGIPYYHAISSWGMEAVEEHTRMVMRLFQGLEP